MKDTPIETRRQDKKVKRISNPLTMLAVFAGLAETAGTVVMPFVSVPLQKFFIWYVMGFPVLLVCLFFYVLIRFPQKFYAPSDYDDEKLFVQMLGAMNAAVIETVQNNPAIEEKITSIDSVITLAARDIVSSSEQTLVCNNIPVTATIAAEDSAVLKTRNNTYYLNRLEISAGRSPSSDIRIEDKTVSLRHCSLSLKSKQWCIVDLGSINGTWINDTKLSPNKVTEINDNDEIRIGNVHFVFCANNARRELE